MEVAGTGRDRKTRADLPLWEFCRSIEFYESCGRTGRGGRSSSGHLNGVGTRDGDSLDSQDSRSASQRLHHGGKGRFAFAIAPSCCAPTTTVNAIKIKRGLEKNPKMAKRTARPRPIQAAIWAARAYGTNIANTSGSV